MGLTTSTEVIATKPIVSDVVEAVKKEPVKVGLDVTGDVVLTSTASAADPRSILFGSAKKTSGDPGTVLQVLGNDCDGGAGGALSLQAGSALSGNKAGGDLVLGSGNGYGTGKSGAVSLDGGSIGIGTSTANPPASVSIGSTSMPGVSTVYGQACPIIYTSADRTLTYAESGSVIMVDTNAKAAYTILLPSPMKDGLKYTFFNRTGGSNSNVTIQTQTPWTIYGVVTNDGYNTYMPPGGATLVIFTINTQYPRIGDRAEFTCADGKWFVNAQGQLLGNIDVYPAA